MNFHERAVVTATIFLAGLAPAVAVADDSAPPAEPAVNAYEAAPPAPLPPPTAQPDPAMQDNSQPVPQPPPQDGAGTYYAPPPPYAAPVGVAPLPPSMQPPPQLQQTQPARILYVAKLGVGFGVPYGGIGVGGELGLRYVSLQAGVGTTVVSGPGWAVGARLYLLPPESWLRPHLSAFYGVTGAYTISGAWSENGTMQGIAAYGGLDHDVGARGGFVLTYAIGVVTAFNPPELVKDQAKPAVKFMLGINYSFGL